MDSNIGQAIFIGNPSDHLLGRRLDGGWTVTERVTVGHSATDGTGGHFTIPYKVRHDDGTEAFLKAMDYSKIFRKGGNLSANILSISAAYVFECAVVEKLNERNLDRVVRALNFGIIYIDESPTVVGQCEYIIFELADGDVRQHLRDFSAKSLLAWRLRCLHHIATALMQIHSTGIAHQDLKPSNVLVFDGKFSKLADFGRANYLGHPVAHDNDPFAGDRSYVPFDLAYGFVLPEWSQRRASCDAYHLGSMLVFFVLGVSMTTLTFSYLDVRFQPSFLGGGWRGDFEAVLPYLRVAFESALREFRENVGDEEIANKLTRIVRELCEPDTRLRGHPKDRRVDGNSFSLRRYVSELSTLAAKAEGGFFKDRN